MPALPYGWAERQIAGQAGRELYHSFPVSLQTLWFLSATEKSLELPTKIWGVREEWTHREITHFFTDQLHAASYPCDPRLFRHPWGFISYGGEVGLTLILLSFALWGYLKDKLNSVKIQNQHHQQQRITRVCLAVDLDMKHVWMVLAIGSGHAEPILLRRGWVPCDSSRFGHFRSAGAI